MSLGMIITDAIVFIVSVVFVYVWDRYVKPWLADKHLSEIANVVVHAAEAAYGAGHGSEKLAYAIKLVNEKYKVDIDEDKIVMAIEAAWKAMDIEQKV